jgi:hypothetical protein
MCVYNNIGGYGKTRTVPELVSSYTDSVTHYLGCSGDQHLFCDQFASLVSSFTARLANIE